MKRTMIGLLFLSLAMTVWAQDEEESDEPQKGFRKEKLFAGGSLTLSFYSGGTVLGANPFVGYLLKDWVDAGLVINYIYAGERDPYDNRIRQNQYGAGAFTRLYPLKFFFLQGQFEHNFIRGKVLYSGGSQQKYKAEANSFLVGGGIAQGREKGSNNFFYISVLVDLIKDPNSPYVRTVYNGNTVDRVDLLPIIRAGVNIALFGGR